MPPVLYWCNEYLISFYRERKEGIAVNISENALQNSTTSELAVGELEGWVAGTLPNIQYCIFFQSSSTNFTFIEDKIFCSKQNNNVRSIISSKFAI